MNERVRRVVQVLLHIEDTPHRTALAFAIGVLIAFSPFIGIHMGIALIVAFLFRLNRVAILFGTYLNPAAWAGRCGLGEGTERRRFGDMLLGRDVNRESAR